MQYVKAFFRYIFYASTLPFLAAFQATVLWLILINLGWNLETHRDFLILFGITTYFTTTNFVAIYYHKEKNKDDSV